MRAVLGGAAVIAVQLALNFVCFQAGCWGGDCTLRASLGPVWDVPFGYGRILMAVSPLLVAAAYRIGGTRLAALSLATTMAHPNLVTWATLPYSDDPISTCVYWASETPRPFHECLWQELRGGGG